MNPYVFEENNLARTMQGCIQGLAQGGGNFPPGCMTYSHNHNTVPEPAVLSLQERRDRTADLFLFYNLSPLAREKNKLQSLRPSLSFLTF